MPVPLAAGTVPLDRGGPAGLHDRARPGSGSAPCPCPAADPGARRGKRTGSVLDPGYRAGHDDQGRNDRPVLGIRALNRATLARQLLLRRASMSAEAAVAHLVGLQAQSVKPPYYALAARLDGFTPEDLSAPMADRRVARLVTLRSTIHTHTADDCLTLRPWCRPPANGS